jgi:hydroxymethylpyrimidine pyrophosphatase-like HAD family hydrolase
LELTGKVTELIYYNDKNSYTVFLFRTTEKSIMCVGYVPFIKIGDKLELIGEYTEHKVYGKQFKVDTYEKKEPTDEEDLLDYLSKNSKNISKVVISSTNSLEKIQEEILNTLDVSVLNIKKYGKFKDKIIDKEYEYLDIIPKNVSKGNALEILGNYLCDLCAIKTQKSLYKTSTHNVFFWT